MNTTTNDLDNGPVISYMRPALIIMAETIGFEWIDIDGTGAVPEIWNGRERCTEAGAAIAVYREPNDNLGASRYQLMRELVAIAEGAPEVDGMRAEQMRELRRALEEAHERAESARELFVHQQRVTESAITQARRWKGRALAAETEAEALHATITSAEMRARIARADVARLEEREDRNLDALAVTHNARRQAEDERDQARDELEQARKNALDVITRVTACLPMPDAITDAAVIEPGFQIDSYFGAEDNIPVVQIDTIGMNGRCRVNLNDGVIWDGDPEHDERPGSNAEPLEHEQPEPVTEITRAEIREITVTKDRDGAGFISLEVGAADSAAVFASVDFPVPAECGHDPRDAERLEVRRNLCKDHMKTIRGHRATINRQIDTIREQTDTIDRLRGERTSEEQRANSAEEQVRLNSNALESVQAELSEARAAQQVSANAGHEYGKRIWAIVRDAAGVAGDPIPTIKELREQRDAAQDRFAECRKREGLKSQQAEAWMRVLEHPAFHGHLGDESMTMNQAVGYRLTELANTEQKWNAQNAEAAPDHMPPTPQSF